MKKATVVRAIGPTIVVVVLAATATLCARAFASGSLKDGKYKGSLTVSATEKVSFKVSASGTKVTNVRVTPYVPNRCGEGGPPPKESSAPAKVRGGKFSAELSEETVNGGVSGTATVTGKFLAGGKVKGLVKNPLPGAKECAGNFPYTAKR